MLVFIEIFEFSKEFIILLNILFCQKDLHHANVVDIEQKDKATLKKEAKNYRSNKDGE